MRSKNSIGIFAILAAIFLAGPAFAHPKLDSAIPAADVSVIASPKEIKLNFSEGIIAKFSGLELKDEGGRAVSTGDPVTDPKDPKQLVVPVSTTLAPGRYTINWHAVSEDTHKVSGDYSFRVIAESAAPQVKSEGSGGGTEETSAKRSTKDEVGNKECFCKDSERTDRVRERSRDGGRDLDQRDRYHDRNFGNREGFRDRDSADRYDSRSRPDCVVDDDGYRYCRVR
jgi:methionine-rich copper-binding protein CopC